MVWKCATAFSLFRDLLQPAKDSQSCFIYRRVMTQQLSHLLKNPGASRGIVNLTRFAWSWGYIC